MQFVKNGPDVPRRLLQAHEERQVVFFCGAGISRSAGLPDFKGLVKKLFNNLNVPPDAAHKSAMRAHQFDTAIDMLEAKVVGGREKVRKEVMNILTSSKVTATHEALLTLGSGRGGPTRVVTTNFDRLFENVIEAGPLQVETFKAPLLPVPKQRWDGLVYLHGLLPAASVEGSSDRRARNELDNLVVSSGDFGRAYLTERWASRFLSELFRNYVVCFVGYGINDPVLRYMMDALAADRMLGESPPKMFAFDSYSKGQKEKCINEWEAKKVTPILYAMHRRHFYLRETLHRWAKMYRDGVGGTEHIVLQYARARPMASTEQDDFVGRMLWALSDPSGRPAKRFAEFDPVPSLEWLEPLSKDRYQQADLRRFEVPPMTAPDGEPDFSLIWRPSPHTLLPWMGIVDRDARGGRWDEVTWHLACWLLRHLNDPALLLWLVKQGGQLHDRFVRLVADRLDELAALEHDGETGELNRIRESAPNAIPEPRMRTLWGLLLTGRVKSPVSNVSLSTWHERFERDGLTPAARLELRDMLTPRVSLRGPLSGSANGENDGGSGRVDKPVGGEVVLSADRVHFWLRGRAEDKRWIAALPELLSDFSGLLRDAVDLMWGLGRADDKSDRSYLFQPSISKHPQNRDSRDWTALIELTRDAWLATAKQLPDQARMEAEAWWRVPYPLFRRLSFFAAAQDDIIPSRRALEWLLADSHEWLWSNETRREAIRLLVALAPRLEEDMLGELEQAILDGPPPHLFKGRIEPELQNMFVDQRIWLRLAKIAETGTVLGAAGRHRLDKLSSQYPEWKLVDDEHDEFPSWMFVGEWRPSPSVDTPRCRKELVKWLRQPPDPAQWPEDGWRQRCREDFTTPALALCVLAGEGHWPTARWRVALQEWSRGEPTLGRSWRYLAPILVGAPGKELQALSDQVSLWLQDIAKTSEGHEAHFFRLARRLLELKHEGGADGDDPVSQAINHPVGYVTEALLRWWRRQPLEDGQCLSGEFRPLFTKLCNTRVNRFRHGRVLLAADAIALFRVDPKWTASHLLPLFDWQRSKRSIAEARSAWDGFLWSAWLYPPLMEALKQEFLDTANHYEELGEYKEQYVEAITLVALDRGDIFTDSELACATSKLSLEDLNEAAWTLVTALESAGDQRADYWTNRVEPYLKAVWPQTQDSVTPTISEHFGHLCIAAGEKFPQALRLLRHWLRPKKGHSDLVRLLRESGLCKKHRKDALDFLDLVIDDTTDWLLEDLRACLEDMKDNSPDIETDG